VISILRQDLSRLLTAAAVFASRPLPESAMNPRRFLALWIDEASTRNRISCQRAAQELGLSVLEVSPGQHLSTEKGESIEDTFQVLARYSDCFAIRSPLISLPLLASLWSQRPVLNLGDGWNEHPSQALSTLLALREIGIDPAEARVAFYGDLDRSRTVRSVVLGLAQLGGTSVLVDDGSASRGTEIAATVEALGLPGTVLLADGLADVAADALYVCRHQRERRALGGSGPRPLAMGDVSRFGLVLHPLPRGDELEPSAWHAIRPMALDHVDRTLKVRTFLIQAMLDGTTLPVASSGSSVGDHWVCANETCLLSDSDHADRFARAATGRCAGCHGPIRWRP